MSKPKQSTTNAPTPPINFPTRSDGSLDFTSMYKPDSDGKYWFHRIPENPNTSLGVWLTLIKNSITDYHNTLVQQNKSVYWQMDYQKYLTAAISYMLTISAEHPTTQA